MSGQISVENVPFESSKISPPDLIPDVYGLHGRNLLEEHLAIKLDKARWAPIPPAIPEAFARAPKDPNIPKTVGILGAGVGGLYAGMMLLSLDIPFEILEASDRTGGRVFTHSFSQNEIHDYYDVGAMRFPEEPVMRRLFHLFRSHQLNSDNRHVASKLIKYYFRSKNAFLYFNSRRAKQGDTTGEDPFDFVVTGVPPEDLEQGYSAILDEVLGPFVEALKRDLEPPGSTSGWQRMMRRDHHSLRSYMSVGCNLSMPTIRWCETMDTSTDSYDRAFSEACLDTVAFGDETTKWWCLDGGSRVLPDAMTDFLMQYSPNPPLQMKTRVTGLRTVGTKDVVGIDVLTSDTTRTYEHVISTIPLPVFRTLDINDERLFDVQQTNALRQLSYGPSVKIGIKFKSQWWAEKFDIVGGQSYSDLNIRTTVYPSYGLEDPNKTTVLIASYTWTSDAAALGALVNENAEDRERLKDLVLRDLARVHDVDLDMLIKEFVDMFPWAWQNDPLTQGAFAFFGPGQYSRLYRSLARPCGGYHLHMAGEALSPRHAWIVGALDASWRAVEEIVLHSYRDKYDDFVRLWGKNQEWIPSSRFLQKIGWENRKWDGKEPDLLMLNITAHDPELLKMK